MSSSEDGTGTKRTRRQLNRWLSLWVQPPLPSEKSANHTKTGCSRSSVHDQYHCGQSEPLDDSVLKPPMTSLCLYINRSSSLVGSLHPFPTVLAHSSAFTHVINSGASSLATSNPLSTYPEVEEMFLLASIGSSHMLNCCTILKTFSFNGTFLFTGLIRTHKKVLVKINLRILKVLYF